MDASMFIGCALCVVMPVASLAACAVVLEGGAPKKATVSWLNAPAPLAAVAIVATLAAFFAETAVHGADAMWALRWAFATNLAVISAWSDFKERIIPNKLVVMSLLVGVVVVAVQVACAMDEWGHLAIDAVGGMIVGGAVFLLTRAISRGGVGFGDVKLFAALGLLVGLSGIISVVFYTAFAAFVVAVVSLVTRKKKLADRLPLGPFALFGVVVAVSFGI